MKGNKQNNRRKILGLNTRNAVYMRPFNPSRAKEIADNKLLSKKILARHGIPTAEIYKVIRNKKQLETLRWEDFPKSFALKPNIGTGGSGIIVFYGRKKGKDKNPEWIRTDGSTMNVQQIKNHIIKILDGQFSMGNRHDIALIEERIVTDPLLKKYSYKGVPDIRVIVFNKVPIMAELRLPTPESKGAANLHAGGIGVGIDIATGITTVAIHRKQNPINFLPGTSDIYNIVETTLDEKELPLRGIQIPKWKQILRIAINCQEVIKLGYLGADIALDRYKGPVIFELNARSGLAIQLANMSGMRERMNRVKGLKIKDADHGIRVAQNLFGGEVEDEVKAVSGRQIIGLIEKATIYAAPVSPKDVKSRKKKRKKNKKKLKDIRIKARINTGTRRSKISPIIASRLGYKPAINHLKDIGVPESFENREEANKYLKENKEKITNHELVSNARVTVEKRKTIIRPIITATVEIAGLTTDMDLMISSRKNMPYPAIIGRKHLKPFLIDASKTFVLH